VIRLYLLKRDGTLVIEVDDAPGGGNNLDSYSSVVEQLGLGLEAREAPGVKAKDA
jgi:hypothetical protein